MSHAVSERIITRTEDRSRSLLASTRAKALLTAVHNRNQRAVEFRLSGLLLPTQGGSDSFTYNGRKVFAVQDPKLSLCDTPQVRFFFENMVYFPQIEVKTFELNRVVVRYGLGTSYSEVTRNMTEVFKTALSLEDDEMHVVT